MQSTQATEETKQRIPYTQAYREFKEDKIGYFDKVGQSLPWIKKYTKVYDQDGPFYKWFPDGVTNACWAALDVHVEAGRGDAIAFLQVDNKTFSVTRHTYQKVYEDCGRVANILKSKFSLEVGDAAIIISNNNYDANIIALALARIGMVFHVSFHVDSGNELGIKVDDLKPRLIITMGQQISYDGKVKTTAQVLRETEEAVQDKDHFKTIQVIHLDKVQSGEVEIPSDWVNFSDLKREA